MYDTYSDRFNSIILLCSKHRLSFKPAAELISRLFSHVNDTERFLNLQNNTVTNFVSFWQIC